MWKELADAGLGVNAAGVAARIRSRGTVPWPNDHEFSEAVRKSDLYNRKVAKYALRQYEEACDGETPNDDFEIEHILPRTPRPEWAELFGDDYARLLHTWANLVPITRSMNPTVGQLGFEAKRAEFSGSMFTSTRKVAEDFVTWSPADVEMRASDLATWAVARWPAS